MIWDTLTDTSLGFDPARLWRPRETTRPDVLVLKVEGEKVEYNEVRSWAAAKAESRSGKDQVQSLFGSKPRHTHQHVVLPQCPPPPLWLLDLWASPRINKCSRNLWLLGHIWRLTPCSDISPILNDYFAPFILGFIETKFLYSCLCYVWLILLILMQRFCILSFNVTMQTFRYQTSFCSNLKSSFFILRKSEESCLSKKTLVSQTTAAFINVWFRFLIYFFAV